MKLLIIYMIKQKYFKKDYLSDVCHIFAMIWKSSESLHQKYYYDFAFSHLDYITTTLHFLTWTAPLWMYSYDIVNVRGAASEDMTVMTEYVNTTGLILGGNYSISVATVSYDRKVVVDAALALLGSTFGFLVVAYVAFSL